MNTKYISTIIAIMFAVAIASAATISITPSSLSIGAYPGETVEKNITILTDGKYFVQITNTNNASIALNYTTPEAIDRNATIPIRFTYPTDIVPGEYIIFIKAEAVYEQVIEQVYSGGGGSSSYYYYNNGNLTNKSYKPLNISYPAVIDLNEEKEEEVTETPIVEKKKWYDSKLLFMLFISSAGIILLYGVYKILTFLNDSFGRTPL